MTENPYQVQPVTNPDYKHQGDWYVDDGLQVIFFFDRNEAQEYADQVWAWDQRDAIRRHQLDRAVSRNLRECFLKRLTVDSETRDRRRKDYNQAIFMPDGPAVFTGTDLEMVMAAFDAAVKDLAAKPFGCTPDQPQPEQQETPA